MVKTKNTSPISLNQIMLNEPRVVEVEGYGTVKVRDPTKQDRIAARQDAMKNPIWESISPEEQDLEVLHRVVIKMIVEPVITEEILQKGKESVIRDIIDSVLLDYSKRMRTIADKRKRTVAGFLELMKANSP